MFLWLVSLFVFLRELMIKITKPWTKSSLLQQLKVQIEFLYEALQFINTPKKNKLYQGLTCSGGENWGEDGIQDHYMCRWYSDPRFSLERATQAKKWYLKSNDREKQGEKGRTAGGKDFGFSILFFFNEKLTGAQWWVCPPNYTF